MSDTVVSVENLSKAYLLGRQAKQDTFFGSVAAVVKSPLRNFRQLHRLNTFNLSEGGEENEDILWALRDVSFEVKQGEVLGIIGRNGAGKSTLLKILSQIAYPTHGRAKIHGRVSALLEVGTGFHPELTGRENVYLNGTILGMQKAEIDSKFDEIVDFSGVEKFLDTPVKRYSSGMKVRLAFSVAAHLEPEILIIDEVLAVGDAEFQKKCLGKMQDISTGEGRTVLFVSHNMRAVDDLCHRAILLDGGTVAANGDPSDIIKQYLQRNQTEIKTSFRSAPNENEEDRDAVLLTADLVNAQEECCDSIRFGEPFGIRLSWEHRKPLPSLSYAIRFSDHFGRLATACNTRNAFDTELDTAGRHDVVCWIDHSAFVPGTYSIRIAASIQPHTIVSGYSACMDLIVEEMAWKPQHMFTIKGEPSFATASRWIHTMGSNSMVASNDPTERTV